MVNAKKATKTTAKITKKMTFQEVFEKFPKHANALATAFMESGMHCLGCAAASFETMEMGCKAHGFSDKQITNLVSKLNKIVKKT